MTMVIFLALADPTLPASGTVKTSIRAGEDQDRFYDCDHQLGPLPGGGSCAGTGIAARFACCCSTGYIKSQAGIG